MPNVQPASVRTYRLNAYLCDELNDIQQPAHCGLAKLNLHNCDGYLCPQPLPHKLSDQIITDAHELPFNHHVCRLLRPADRRE